MSTASQEFLNPGILYQLGPADLKGQSKAFNELDYPAGGWAFMSDAFGMRILAYLKCAQSAGQTVGELAGRQADVDITNATSGTTTSVVTSSLTADAHFMDLLHVADNDDSAGAAPEGEVGSIVSNSATVVRIHPGRPFSAAIAANDDLEIFSMFGAIDATDSMVAADVMGICFHGIATQYRWGFYQIYGFYPAAATNTAATAEDADVGIEDGLNQFGDGQVTGIEDVIGYAPLATAADRVNLFGLLFINLLAVNFRGTSP